MNKKKIYFVRHGQSEANVKGVFAGQKENSPLTDKGKKQAIEAARDLISRNIKVQKIYSSPLMRAKQTAEIIIKEMGSNVEFILDERIAEYDMGSLTGTPIRKVTSKELITAVGAEDAIGFSERVHEMLNDLLNEIEEVLVVSHAGVGRIIEAKKIGKSPHSFYDLDPYPNARVIEIEHKNSQDL